MSGWAVTFLIVALVAAMLAFGGVPGLAVTIAQVIFVIALTAAALAGLVAFLRKTRRARRLTDDVPGRDEEEQV